MRLSELHTVGRTLQDMAENNTLTFDHLYVLLPFCDWEDDSLGQLVGRMRLQENVDGTLTFVKEEQDG